MHRVAISLIGFFKKMSSFALSRAGRFARGASGGLLVETVVAVMVLSAVGTAVLGGLSTTQISGEGTEHQSLAENIARNQMEYIASLPYQAPTSAYPTVAVPAGYAVTATAEEDVAGDTNIERVVVTISFGGEHVMTVETFRVRPQ